MSTSNKNSMASLATSPSTPARVSRGLALLGLVGLTALGLAWELWLAPTGRGTLAVKVLPLVAALPGLWRYRLYTFRWLSLLVWLYAAEGCVRAYGDPGVSAALAAAELLLSLLTFTACAWHVRARLKTVPRQTQERP